MDYLIKHRHSTHIREFRLRFKEWHSLLFHNLTNQPKDHERIRMFRYCIQIKILTSSVRIRNSVCTCLDGFKAGSKFRFVFPREFSSLFRASRVQLGLLRLLSCGDLRRLRDVIGKSSPPQSLTSWLRYGFGTVLDPLRWLVSLRESPAGRLPGQPCARLSAQEFRSARELQEEERASTRTRLVFSTVRLGHPQRRLVQSERRYGAEPRLPGWFLQSIFNGEKNNFWSLY